jgi:hypothetical protein
MYYIPKNPLSTQGREKTLEVYKENPTKNPSKTPRKRPYKKACNPKDKPNHDPAQQALQTTTQTKQDLRGTRLKTLNMDAYIRANL